MVKKIYYVLSGICLLSLSVGMAQTTYVVRGKVQGDKEDRRLSSVMISGFSGEYYAVTDEQGVFQFRLPGGPNQLKFQLLGYQSSEESFNLKRDTSLLIVLKESSFQLEEVRVTADERKAGSVSVLSRAAIEHTQPYSLKDVLQLVPGQLATNPNLTDVQQVILRQANTGQEARYAAALGTQLVIDGVPLSNNGSLQRDVGILNSYPGVPPAFSSATGMGNDLRQVAADDMESMEVVRGLPSVRYGDLTSGLIIVNTRFGELKPEVILRLNAQTLQAGAYYGFKGGRNQVFNTGMEYLAARPDLRNQLDNYQRITGKFSWQQQGNAFIQTHQINVFSTLDDHKTDPASIQILEHNSRDRGVRYQTEGKLNKLFASEKGRLTYTASVSYQEQRSYRRTTVSRGAFPIGLAFTDTVMPGLYTSSYMNETRVHGAPLSAYGRLETTWLLGKANQHRFHAGTEYRMDANYGRGRSFDLDKPPLQNYSMGDRPDDLSYLRSLHQWSLYAEDEIAASLFGLNTQTVAGIRFDQLLLGGSFGESLGGSLSPRISTRVFLFPGLGLRAGAGLASKAPTLHHLFPGYRYFDLVSLNHYANNPDERLVMLTTYRFDLNSKLKPYQSAKAEIGADWEKQGGYYAVTAFTERTPGAYGYNREVTPLTFDVYGIASRPEGRPPVLLSEPVRVDTFFAAVDRPVNNRVIHNRGIEYIAEFPAIPHLRTRIHLNGAYLWTRSYDDGFSIEPALVYASDDLPEFIPVYRTYQGMQAVQMNTSLRVIHHLPRAGFMLSALWQAVWVDQNRYQAISPLAQALINRQGEWITLSPEQSASSEYVQYRRPEDSRPDLRYPPLHLLNLRVTKSLANGSQFAFFINNVFNSRPLHRNDRLNRLDRRNEPVFFGAEFKLRIQ